MFLIVFCCCLASLEMGCSIFTPKKDVSRFYTFCGYDPLEKVSDSSSLRRVIINIIVGEIPSYADCPYIVTVSTNDRLILSEVDRWAEPLQDACTRALTNKLSELMYDYAMVIPSAYTKGNVFLCDYLISIGFSDFIYNEAEKKVILECTWSLVDFATKNQILVCRYAKSIPSSNSNYENVVVTMKLALYELAQDIATKVDQFYLDLENRENSCETKKGEKRLTAKMTKQNENRRIGKNESVEIFHQDSW
jgi:uncharacterized lipoprotein YmbA